jgi:hypothetical protein
MSEFVIETDPTPEQIQYLEDRLYEFNSQTTGICDGEGLAIFVRNETPPGSRTRSLSSALQEDRALNA